MAAIFLPLAAHILTAAILSLVLPLAVLIVVAAWYWRIFERGMFER